MLKNSFETLSFRDKILLYIIVVIGFLFLFILLEKFVFIEEKQKKVQHDKSVSIKSLADKIVIKHDKFIFEYIENELGKEDILIDSISAGKQTISLDISGSFRVIMSVLHELESHLIIEEFVFSKSELKDNMVQIRVVFLNHYFINQNKISNKIKNIINPFESNTTNIMTKIQPQIKPILIDAIIGDEVLIEDIWYKKDESYLDYKIVKIEKTFVKLLDIQTKEAKTIRLEDE